MHINIEKKFSIKKESIKNPVVLIGWPGIAFVAKLAITSIIESIDAKEFLNIQYFDFSPRAVVEKGSLEIPTAKLYYKSAKQDEENDLFILTASYQPQTPEGVFEFSKIFCEEMDKITEGKIQMYVSTGAIPSESVQDNPLVYVCGTDQDLVQSFLKFDNTKIHESGYISGANGIIPAYAGCNNFAPGLCLLAETIPLPMMTFDPRSSKALVSLIKDYFSLDMDFSKLNEKIKEMEHVFESFKKQADQFMKPPQEDKGADSYFR
ncbi:MAG: PAC2 family protein [Promethearchaeota archaeon]|jgi:proteasome assembly chaperone (PAC2) family protein